MIWINKGSSTNLDKELLPINSVHDLVEKTKKLAINLSETHIQTSSWLIINAENNRCKWHCVSESDFPIICWRWENCNNLNRAEQIIKKISDFEHQKTLEDLY